ncbi:uncharacterized protein [Mycetomoellerius zeteki]|uniref:uncharacterized protein n=1 Tax=Mycetomoellerius zeteki TaxID=64791 RepID=UPI00084E8ED8|nr:PREDICTED: uncharacterized protein LOC108729587 [Trachymyrmex zeteki]
MRRVATEDDGEGAAEMEVRSEFTNIFGMHPGADDTRIHPDGDDNRIHSGADDTRIHLGAVDTRIHLGADDTRIYPVGGIRSVGPFCEDKGEWGGKRKVGDTSN